MKNMKKKVALILIWLLVFIAAVPSGYADSALMKEGESFLDSVPPQYEKAAEVFKTAGLQGDGEGYYRLALMYEEGLLTAGDPCTDDLDALGKKKAEEYYKLAAENGYEKTTASAWQSITQDEAKKMMAKDDGHVIVDVRRQDEYDAGHIPEAILIPNESILDSPPEALPDKEQIILVYCRSGNRSKQAAQKLADMGYANVYEFGGINTWDGGIEMKGSALMTEDDPEWDCSVPAEITEEIRTLFDDAMKGLVGVGYTPIAVLGRQGDTYCILCKAAAVYPGAKPYNALVYINDKGLQNIYEIWIDKHAEKEEFTGGTSNCA